MRYRLLDTLRGYSLASMILFHTCWDLVYLYGYDWTWYKGTPGYLWQQSICWAFILISGFCMGLPKDDRPLAGSCRRGLLVLAAGCLVTAATVLFTPDSPIIFGVLFFLGSAMLLTAALRPLLRNCSCRGGLLVSAALFFLLRNINDGSLGFENLILCPLPDVWYGHGLLATFVGLRDKNFFSADYFSLLPWYFLFLAGFFLCRCFLENRETEFFGKGIPVFETMGRHSLLIYLLHQPVILLLLSVIF